MSWSKRKSTTASAMALGILLALSSPAHSQWQVGAPLLAGSAMNGVVDNIRDSIRESMERADQSVSSGAFLARMQLQLLLAEVDYRATNVVDKTFGELNQTQQAFFRNTSQTVDALEELGDSIAENADVVVQRVEFLTGNTILGSNEPRLRSHFPFVVETAPPDDSRGQRVSFSGSWLANGNPTLVFGDIECKLIDLKEPTASFECPRNLFTTKSEFSVIDGHFRAIAEIGFINWLWTSIFGSMPYKEYPVSVGVVPNTFGSFALTTTRSVNQRETNGRTMPFDTGARHCTSGSETLVNITPSSGWEVDGSSISVHVNSSNGGYHELRNVTNAGFQLFARGLNSGNCVKAMGQTISKDARGWHNGNVSWTEFRDVENSVTEELLDTTINWGDSRVVTLPEKTKSFLISLKRFDGKVREYNAPTTDDFLHIRTDDSSGSLSIEPKAVDEVFSENY